MEAKASNLGEMQARLKELATRIQELEAKAQTKHSDVETYMEQVGTLHTKHKTASQILGQIEEATHEELKTLKSGWEEIVKDMQEVLDKLASSY